MKESIIANLKWKWLFARMILGAQISQWRGLPSVIELEASSACNRRCHYCPQSIKPTKQQIVSEEMWSLFLTRLREFKYRGWVGLSHFNEWSIVPNSDKYIADIVQIGCKPIIHSNGDKPDVMRKWVSAGAKRIIITEHPPFKENWAAPITKLESEFPHIVFVRRLQSEAIFNRNGVVDAESTGNTGGSCGSLNMLHFDVEGKMLLCCIDYKHAEYKDRGLGDLRKQSIQQIWSSPKIVKMQKRLRNKQSVSEICHLCFGEPQKT